MTSKIFSWYCTVPYRTVPYQLPHSIAKFIKIRIFEYGTYGIGTLLPLVPVPYRTIRKNGWVVPFSDLHYRYRTGTSIFLDVDIPNPKRFWFVSDQFYETVTYLGNGIDVHKVIILMFLELLVLRMYMPTYIIENIIPYQFFWIIQKLFSMYPVYQYTYVLLVTTKSSLPYGTVRYGTVPGTVSWKFLLSILHLEESKSG